mgnify:FL=1
MNKQFSDVAAALSLYFDGLYHSKTELLRTMFHREAIYVCADKEPLIYRTMADYFAIVDKRPSPASRNEARRDRILSIEFAGPNTALARVNCAIGDSYFTDLLSLIHVDGRWQIIAKVFHGAPLAA